INELIYANRLSGESGTRNVLLGGLAGLAYKTKNAKYKLNIMHLQNGENEAAILRLDNNDDARGQSGYIANSDNLEYGQRGLTNILLNGKHFTEDGSWTIDWRLSPTISRIDEPDIRKTAFTEIGARETFAAGAGGLPSRLWRNLEEVNLVGRIDLTKEFEINEEAAKFKFGFSQVNKERDYEILQYSVQFFGAQPTWTGNANEVLQPANTFPSGTIYYASGNTFPNPNEYNSTVSNTAGYASLEFTPLTKVKTVVGLRAEKFLQKHTGRDQRGEFDLVDAEVLDALDFFPSANIIYGVSEKQNLRVSYSRTIARPSFKELSFAQILDPASNRLFNGGLFPFEGEWDGNLRETLINNFDIRWEFFGDRAQLFSVSGFYKSFADPIELVRIPEQVTITEVQPRNVGDGTVFGVEVEFRKALDFLAEENSPWSVSGNLTLANSSIDRTPSEIRSREDNARTGQDIADTRQMAGQAPYIINAGLSYNNPDKGFDAGLFYNVKGPTLLIVGGGIFPDVFTEPFNSLNFNLNKNIGEEQRTSLNFKVSNLLGDVREEVFTGFEAENQLYTRFSPGISFGLGVKYSIY
ncbi:MAG: TonB-dependent receptor, partial [Bacteroidota bacterium]